jgi:hypothetical protein
MPATFEAADLRVAQQLADAAQRDNHAARLLTELCTQIGARPAGSAADAKAVAWAQAAMTGLGLTRVRAEPLALRVWQRGAAAARVLTPEVLPLTMAALGNSVATPAEGITAEVAWYGSLARRAASSSSTRRPNARATGAATARPWRPAPSGRWKRPGVGRWPWASAPSAPTANASPTPARCATKSACPASRLLPFRCPTPTAWPPGTHKTARCGWS